MQLKQNLMMSCGTCGVGERTATMAPCSRAQGRGTFADADDHRWCKQRNHQAEDELFALDVTLDFEKERASDALAKTEGRYTCDDHEEQKQGVSSSRSVEPSLTGAIVKPLI